MLFYFKYVILFSPCRCVQIELTRTYDHNAFFEDLRKMYMAAGAKNLNIVFLFTDTQIVQEDFLEDINNILNSGKFLYKLFLCVQLYFNKCHKYFNST